VVPGRPYTRLETVIQRLVHIKFGGFDAAVDQITRDDDQIRSEAVLPARDGFRSPDRE